MIQRIEPKNGLSRAVVHNGVIYFGGHVAGGKQPTMYEQTKALLARYDELFAQFGTDKDHLIFVTIYLQDMTLKPDMQRAWLEWMNSDNAPTRICVQAGLEPGYLLEMTVTAELINQ